MDDLKKILRDLISLDSQCTKSNKKIVEYIKTKLSRFEIKEYLFSRNGIDLYNLVVKIHGENSNSPLIFVGHTDTVPGSENWNGQEFSPLEKDGKIYGLGSSDMKSGLACIIFAALSLKQKPKNDVYLVFDADEEDQGQGARELIKEISISNAQVILAEATDRKITYAHKGCLDLIIETTGIAQHSSKTDSATNEQQNAIYKSSKILSLLIAYGKKIEDRTDSLLGKSTLNIGKIEGGTAANVVADKCIIKICRRILPRENIEEVYNEIKNVVLLEDKFAKVTSTFWAPSFLGDKSGKLANELTKISADLGLKIDFQVKSSTTEAGIFSKFGETLIFGPGQTEFCHQPNESVKLTDLEIFSQIYSRLIS